MRSLTQWQKELGQAISTKFPNKNWSQQDRVLAILRQLADVGGAIQNEKEILATNNHSHTRPDFRIACLLADIFALAYERNSDLDAELEKVLAWFKNIDAQPGRDT